MIQTIGLGLFFGTRKLFDDVNLKFISGNCYGVIGANGAGKSTFLKVLSGEIPPTKGSVAVGKNQRVSTLEQNQNAFDNKTVLDTVMGGYERLYEIMKMKEQLYSKPDFSEADGEKAAELESEFAELGGWEAESQAQSLLNALKIDEKWHNEQMGMLDAKSKVKVLLARVLFGNPDILLLDEPTNNLDAKTVRWLEDYIMELESTVIIVSHNRHFLNKVCTHICDVDYSQINIFFGNYDFWYETSQLMARQVKEANKKAEVRAKELMEFIARFSANASKSRQATSRKKELEKLTLDDFKPSSRKYPFVGFSYLREIGNDILFVENLTKKPYFENLSFTVNKNDKISFVCDKSVTVSALFDCLNGVTEPDKGSIKWGQTIIKAYMPQNNSHFFDGSRLNLVQWLDQYSKEHNEEYLRGWLGRMLFSGNEALKQVSVLSGGERVRCMLAKTMLEQANFITLDEPTNHLDLEAITALNKGMTAFKGGILFTSHDHELNNTVANRIIEISNGKKILDKEISYDDYIDQKTDG